MVNPAYILTQSTEQKTRMDKFLSDYSKNSVCSSFIVRPSIGFWNRRKKTFRDSFLFHNVMSCLWSWEGSLEKRLLGPSDYRWVCFIYKITLVSPVQDCCINGDLPDIENFFRNLILVKTKFCYHLSAMLDNLRPMKKPIVIQFFQNGTNAGRSVFSMPGALSIIAVTLQIPVHRSIFSSKI